MVKFLGRGRKSGRHHAGCVFLILNGVFLVALYLVNNLLIKGFFSLRTEESDERLIQAGQLLLPLALLFVQLWIFDQIRESRRSRK